MINLEDKRGKFFLDLIGILTGALFLSLPATYGALWPLGFISLLPLFLRTRNRPAWHVFWISFFSFFLYINYILIWLKLYGYHWLLLLNFMNAITYAGSFVLYYFIRAKLKSDFYGLLFPLLFVLSEYGKTLGLLAFPWPYLSHGQYANLYLIQISEFTGVWGVTFILTWVNVVIFNLLMLRFSSTSLLKALPAVLTLLLSFGYGTIVLNRDLPEGDTQVSLFQRDKNTMEEWTVALNKKAWEEYSDMTLQEWINNLDMEQGGFIVWPEGSIPDALLYYSADPAVAGRKQMIHALVDSLQKTFIIGTQDYSDTGPHNTAAIFKPDLEQLELYNKVRLVPFGEVIPLEAMLKSWFPEYPWGSESIRPGRKLAGIDTDDGRIGVIICYESFFPDLTRRIVADDCEFLFLVTNTSWFGPSKASFQHAHYDVFRAVENRIWLSRAATTGVSSFIDPCGRRYDETGLYVKAAVSRRIGKRLYDTFYTKYGDWLPRACLIASLILLTLAIYRKNN